MAYYLTKTGFTIIPRLSHDDFSIFVKHAIIYQSIGMVTIGLGLVYSYLRDISIIKPILYLQAIIMSSSNFNEYHKGDLTNFQGLNMLSTLMSAIIALTNTYLANIVIVSEKAKMLMTCLVFGSEFSIIVFTNF